MTVAQQDFELDGFGFGKDGDVVVSVFSPTGPATRASAADNPRADSRWFGRDRRTPGTWAWSLFVNRDDELGAFETLAALQNAWDAERVRQTPGAVSVLRYAVAGRTRRVYGRPGRCQETYDIRRLSGYIAVEADFVLADTLHYDDDEHSVFLSVLPAGRTGGLKAPLKAPLRSIATPAVPRSNLITVGGTTPTWAVVEIRGGSDVSVGGDGWTVAVEGEVAEDEVVTIDPRPWVRSATSNLGRRVPLTPASRLEAMRLAPGPNELRYNATSPNATASVTVRWRNASKTI